ncbi:hypothetical protein GCM10010277_44730 [Streptomyces longisporoflavus]|nr:hypothetical protein GCM10010277_44730 [Streptomyces longisporoflavus]
MGETGEMGETARSTVRINKGRNHGVIALTPSRYRVAKIKEDHWSCIKRHIATQLQHLGHLGRRGDRAAARLPPTGVRAGAEASARRSEHWLPPALAETGSRPSRHGFPR